METAMVPFHGDIIEAVYDSINATIHVVCKRVAENLGCDWSSQLQVLRGHELLRQKLFNGVITIGGRPYETLCLPLKYLPIWLAGIQIRRVRPDIRAKLLLYQEECAEVLAEYFLGGGVVIKPEAPVRSTLDVLEGIHQANALIIQQVKRQDHLLSSHSHELTRLEQM